MPKRTPLYLDAVARDAQQSTLAALASAEHADEVLAAARPVVPRGDFAAGVAILKLAVTALDLAAPTGSSPLEYYGLRERYLPEIEFRGRVEHRNSQWAIYAAACLRGGLEPDFGGDTGWWRSPLWIYTSYALTLYSRAAAERLNTTILEVAQQIAQRHGVDPTQLDIASQE